MTYYLVVADDRTPPIRMIRLLSGQYVPECSCPVVAAFLALAARGPYSGQPDATLCIDTATIPMRQTLPRYYEPLTDCSAELAHLVVAAHTQPPAVHRTAIRRLDDGYVVLAYDRSGHRIPGYDYYTPDRSDAADTASAMLRGGRS